MNDTFKRIKGTKNYYVTCDGYIFKRTGDYSFRQVKICYNKVTGYAQALIRLKSKEWLTIQVHRAVAQHFCEKPRYARNLEINHKDGNKFNNASYNLSWVSHQENIKHGWDLGLFKNVAPAIRKKRAELKRRKTELTTDDVQTIRRLRKSGLTLRKLGYIYNLHAVSVCAICNRRTFKNVA